MIKEATQSSNYSQDTKLLISSDAFMATYLGQITALFSTERSCRRPSVMGKSQIKSQCQITNLWPHRFKSFCKISIWVASPNQKSLWSKS